jgi:hypothetical protein
MQYLVASNKGWFIARYAHNLRPYGLRYRIKSGMTGWSIPINYTGSDNKE